MDNEKEIILSHAVRLQNSGTQRKIYSRHSQLKNFIPFSLYRRTLAFLAVKSPVQLYIISRIYDIPRGIVGIQCSLTVLLPQRLISHRYGSCYCWYAAFDSSWKLSPSLSLFSLFLALSLFRLLSSLLFSSFFYFFPHPLQRWYKRDRKSERRRKRERESTRYAHTLSTRLWPHNPHLRIHRPPYTRVCKLPIFTTALFRDCTHVKIYLYFNQLYWLFLPHIDIIFAHVA